MPPAPGKMLEHHSPKVFPLALSNIPLPYSWTPGSADGIIPIPTLRPLLAGGGSERLSLSLCFEDRICVLPEKTPGSSSYGNFASCPSRQTHLLLEAEPIQWVWCSLKPKYCSRTPYRCPEIHFGECLTLSITFMV